MTAEKKDIRRDEIWHSRCPVPTPLAIAVQQGWVEKTLWKECGVKLRSLHESNNPVEAVSYHESPLPNSFRQGGSVPSLWARANGQQTRVVGLTWTDEYQAIVAMPGARLGNVRELRGRRIGIPLHDVKIDHSRAAAMRAFSAILATEGMTLADVEIVDLFDQEIPVAFKDGAVISTGTGRRGRYSYTNQIRALARGDVDAVYVKDAQGAQATHLLGANVIANIGRHPDAFVRINNCTPRPLTVSQWLIDKQPDVLRHLLAQTVLAGRWAAAHPEKVLTLVGRETGWAENWVRYAYGDNIHQHLHLDLAEESIKGLGVFKDFLVGQGFIPADFSLRDWIAPEPLQEVMEILQRHPTVYSLPPAASSMGQGVSDAPPLH
jgi:ABC-type nitrate/sulfonate/bicarbonate transport system substrate-binding protein